MIDGLLFVLILINFAITLTLFLRYNRSQEEDRAQEIREEMTDMLVKFNKDAERNIRIIEDRIQKSKDQFSRQEIMLKAMETTIEKRESNSEMQIEKLDNRQLNHEKLNINKEENNIEKQIIKDAPIEEKLINQQIEKKEKAIASPIQFEDFEFEKSDEELKDRINFKQFIEKYSKTADNPLIIKSKQDKQDNIENHQANDMIESNKQEILDNIKAIENLENKKIEKIENKAENLAVKKSFIQRAYQSSPVKTKNQAENKNEEKASKKVDNKENSNETTNVEETIQSDADLSRADLSRKDKIRQVARYIGEGKSFEEISEIMNMSMTEIDLFKSLIKNKITK